MGKRQRTRMDVWKFPIKREADLKERNLQKVLRKIRKSFAHAGGKRKAIDLFRKEEWQFAPEYDTILPGCGLPKLYTYFA